MAVLSTLLIPLTEEIMKQQNSKDIWEKLTALAALLASVLVPVVLAFVGNAYSNALKQAENRVKYTD